MERYFIELALWNKFSFYRIFFDQLSGDIPCIRYDKDTYVYLDGTTPKYKKSMWMNISYSETRDVDECVYLRGKDHLTNVVKNKKQYDSGKEFIEDYMRNLRKC